MLKKASYDIYIFDQENFLTLNSEESRIYFIEETPSFFTWVSAFRCKECGQVMVISDEARLDETHERQMGPEHFYSGEAWLHCPKCHQSITVNVFLNEYAHGWIFDDMNQGVEGMTIDGLEWLAEEYSNAMDLRHEKENLQGVASMLKHRVNDLIAEAKKKEMYLLIVEGKDDRAIWEQFMLREDIPLSCIDIEVYGDGGADGALRLASLFRGKKLQLIPHKLIIDSDNNMKAAMEKMKDKQIDEKHYHILEKKEIESYLLDEEAIARVLSIDINDLKKFNANLQGVAGKERLDKIFRHFTGHKPDDQAKGLVARALQNTPEEIRSIINEIRNSLAFYEDSNDDRS